MKPAGAYGGNRFNYRIRNTRRSPARQYCDILKKKRNFGNFFLLNMLIYWGSMYFWTKKKPLLEGGPKTAGAFNEGRELPCLPPSGQQNIRVCDYP